MSPADRVDDIRGLDLQIRKSAVLREDAVVVRLEFDSRCEYPVQVEVAHSSPEDEVGVPDGGTDPTDTDRQGVKRFLRPGESATVEFRTENEPSDLAALLDVPVSFQIAPTGIPEASAGTSVQQSEDPPRGGTLGGVSDTDRTEWHSGANGVLLGIPAYNESETVASVVTEAMGYVDEVLLVDDGSTDGTARLARNAGATVIRHPTNRGYGAALGTIFAEAHRRGYEHLVILDADGQHDTSDIPELLAAQASDEADLVIGSRFMTGGDTNMPAYRRAGIAIVNVLANFGLKFGYSTARLSDTQSGFRLYSADAIRTLAHAPDLGTGMDASTDVLFTLAKAGYRFAEVPTTVDYDVDEASTHNPLIHGVSLVRSIVARLCRERPGFFLGFPAFLCLVAAVVVAISVVTVPSLITLTLMAGLIALSGLLSGGALALHDRSPRRSY